MTVPTGSFSPQTAGFSPSLRRSSSLRHDFALRPSSTSSLRRALRRERSRSSTRCLRRGFARTGSDFDSWALVNSRNLAGGLAPSDRRPRQNFPTTAARLPLFDEAGSARRLGLDQLSSTSAPAFQRSLRPALTHGRCAAASATTSTRRATEDPAAAPTDGVVAPRAEPARAERGSARRPLAVW